MSPEILALIEKPHLLLALMLVGAAFGMGAERISWRLRRKKWRQFKRQRGQKNFPGGRLVQDKSAPQDSADQLRIVMRANFYPRSVLNRSESRVFKALDSVVLSHNPLWQVMAQVSLGEIISTKDKEAYSCVNSKRVDFLLMDEKCKPRHVIEYQGDGHHQNAAAARDAVKKEALRKAGIGYHEVVAGHTKLTDLKKLIEKLVDQPESEV